VQANTMANAGQYRRIHLHHQAHVPRGRHGGQPPAMHLVTITTTNKKRKKK
jgi:hypothetical protein